MAKSRMEVVSKMARRGSRKGADAEEAAKHGGCGQEGDQSERDREVGTGRGGPQPR